eukprot:scaffold441053_cov17-Prasinocladus_malaysianus.AAC.1
MARPVTTEMMMMSIDSTDGSSNDDKICDVGREAVIKTRNNSDGSESHRVWLIAHLVGCEVAVDKGEPRVQQVEGDPDPALVGPDAPNAYASGPNDGVINLYLYNK